MAYMSFSPLEADGRNIHAATAADVSSFTPLELHVIELGVRVDVGREVSPSSRSGRFLERFLGIKLGRPLANPRLEQLRRFVSLARYHPEELHQNDIVSMIDAGFSTQQTHGLLEYFSKNV